MKNIFLIVLMFSIFNELHAQENIETKVSIYKDVDGKEISQKKFKTRSKSGNYKYLIRDLENGKQEIKLYALNDTEEIKNREAIIYNDEDGKEITREEFNSLIIGIGRTYMTTKKKDDNYNVISTTYKVNKNEQFNLSNEIITLPFHLFNGFMLVEGEVNGKKGKFMFDTGTPVALMLNNNYLSFPKKIKSGEYTVSSGQKDILYRTTIIKASFGNDVSFKNLHNIFNADFGFIQEGITNDFLGFIGYEFIKNYEFLIDYDNQLIKLYKIDEKGVPLKPYHIDQEIFETLNFTTKENTSQMPVILIEINKKLLNGKFDTGNQGGINLNNNDKIEFIASNSIISNKNNCNYGQYYPDSESINLLGFNYNATSFPKIRHLSLHENEESYLDLGYQFLKNYISVWNYKTKTIKLFKP